MSNNKLSEMGMTEQEMIELWGDGTEFGLSSPIKIGYRGDNRDMGVLNNAFGEVAMRFASKVAEIAYQKGREDGEMEATPRRIALENK